MNPSKVSVVKAVGRRMVPYLVEATLIPTVLFYVFLLTFELKWAIVAALAWTYAAKGRPIVLGRPIPGLLVLATLGISVRTVVYLLSGNDFVYFFQPIMRTVATAAMFALSVRIGRPLIARFAADFCPLTPEVQIRPGDRAVVPPTHLLVGRGQRRRRRGDVDPAADGAGRRLRRHVGGLGVGHHLHRRRAHGVGLRSDGASRRTPHRGRVEREVARRGRPVQLIPCGDACRHHPDARRRWTFGVDQDVEHLTDRAFLGDRFSERQMRLDLVAVAPAVLDLHDVAPLRTGR